MGCFAGHPSTPFLATTRRAGLAGFPQHTVCCPRHKEHNKEGRPCRTPPASCPWPKELGGTLGRGLCHSMVPFFVCVHPYANIWHGPLMSRAQPPPQGTHGCRGCCGGYPLLKGRTAVAIAVRIPREDPPQGSSSGKAPPQEMTLLLRKAPSQAKAHLWRRPRLLGKVSPREKALFRRTAFAPRA